MAPAKGNTAAKDEAKVDETAATGSNGDEGKANAEVERQKRVRSGQPTYGIKKVSKIPENAKIHRKPSNRNTYRDLLTPVTEDESLWGEWLQIAEFTTPTGARMKMKEFTGTFEKDGTPLSPPTVVPPGEGFVWEFAARRLEREIEGETNEDGSVKVQKYSVLFAKCEPAT